MTPPGVGKKIMIIMLEGFTLKLVFVFPIEYPPPILVQKWGIWDPSDPPNNLDIPGCIGKKASKKKHLPLWSPTAKALIVDLCMELSSKLCIQLVWNCVLSLAGGSWHSSYLWSEWEGCEQAWGGGRMALIWRMSWMMRNELWEGTHCFMEGDVLYGCNVRLCGSIWEPTTVHNEDMYMAI